MKKYIFLALIIFIILILSNNVFNCRSRIDPDHSSFKTCLKQLIGRDKPLPEPEPREEMEIRLLEGWSIKDMANYFEKINLFTKEEFIESTFLKSFIIEEEVLNEDGEKNIVSINLLERFEFLKDLKPESSLQGYLYPDTYRIFVDSKPRDVIIRMLENFDKKLSAEMRENIKKQSKTIHEIVTLASIIEKEAPIDYQKSDNYDAKMIAGVFYNRLNNNQALESCATLAFILGVNKEQYSLEDTRVESPYNTYLHRGLPPGPITNPGNLAILAAIEPIDNNYFFFLTPSKTRDIIYSRTYQEHLNNKYKYIR